MGVANPIPTAKMMEEAMEDVVEKQEVGLLEPQM
jgi:hypothetical protein